MSKKRGHLREGFTTGTAATAAAMAATMCALKISPYNALTTVRTPLPPFLPNADNLQGDATSWYTVPVLTCAYMQDAPPTASATVQKDGGDDPDTTHGAYIVAEVRLVLGPRICIHAGEGIGYATLPGLPIAVGEPAINPIPRAQICFGLEHVARTYGYTQGIHLTLSVKNGARIAQKTFNPRLGIVGGISILGTHGTVKPFSHEAWKTTITQGMDVAVATQCHTLCLTTGRRSEKMFLAQYPQCNIHSCVQVADFAEFSLKEAARRPFGQLAWACFFGKLIKLAAGHGYTHAQTTLLDMNLLATWCAEAGSTRQHDIVRCITASHALEILLDEGKRGMDAIYAVAHRAATTLCAFAGKPVRVHLFHTNGKELLHI